MQCNGNFFFFGCFFRPSFFASLLSIFCGCEFRDLFEEVGVFSRVSSILDHETLNYTSFDSKKMMRGDSWGRFKNKIIFCITLADALLQIHRRAHEILSHGIPHHVPLVDDWTM